MKRKIQHVTKQSLIVITGTFILSLVLLYNGYPLVYSDSGTYIWSGMKDFVPFDRPAVYGFFIRHSSLNESLWYVALFQNFILSYILHELFKFLIPKNQLLVI